MDVTVDNAFELGKNRKGWFLGHFMDNPCLRTDDIEIQLIKLAKGHSKESKKVNHKVKAVTILIKGCFELEFPKENKKVVLERQGDFVLFDLSSKHIGKAIKDTQIITIKWPSVR